jgi:hypothetical protein
MRRTDWVRLVQGEGCGKTKEQWSMECDLAGWYEGPFSRAPV